MTATYIDLPPEAQARYTRWLGLINQLADEVRQQRRDHADDFIPGYSIINDAGLSKTLTDAEHLAWFSTSLRLPRYAGVPHFLSSLLSPSVLVIADSSDLAQEILRSATVGYLASAQSKMLRPSTAFTPQEVEHHVLDLPSLEKQFKHGSVATHPSYHHLDRVYVLSSTTEPLKLKTKLNLAFFSRLEGVIPFLVFIDT